jgi:hypothetical protein
MGTYRALKHHSVVRVHLKGNWIVVKGSFVRLQTRLPHCHVEQQIVFEKFNTLKGEVGGDQVS